MSTWGKAFSLTPHPIQSLLLERVTTPPLPAYRITSPEHPRVNFRERQRTMAICCNATRNSAAVIISSLIAGSRSCGLSGMKVTLSAPTMRAVSASARISVLVAARQYRRQSEAESRCLFPQITQVCNHPRKRPAPIGIVGSGITVHRANNPETLPRRQGVERFASEQTVGRHRNVNALVTKAVLRSQRNPDGWWALLRSGGPRPGRCGPIRRPCRARHASEHAPRRGRASSSNTGSPNCTAA